jgi:hypothetical protein
MPFPSHDGPHFSVLVQQTRKLLPSKQNRSAYGMLGHLPVYLRDQQMVS